MKLIATKANRQQKLALLTAGALAVAPFLNPITAQAEPPSQAPAHGYYKNKDDKRDKRDKGDKHDRKHERWHEKHDRDRDDDRWEDRDDRREDRDERWEKRRDRDDDWRNRRDDDWRRNDDRRNGQNNQPINQPVNFAGTVVRVDSARQLVVRGDNGRTYTVSTSSNISSRINNGDRIRVVGRTTNNGIWANNVNLIDDRNGNGGNNSGWGSRVNFAGTIARVEGRTLWVRGDNGQTYKVLYNGNAYFRTGDRVRVVGSYTNGAVNATSVTR